MTRLRLLVAVACLAFASLSFAADTMSLQQRMTPAEFKAAGLDKLSADELAALNAFLGRDTAARVAEAKKKEDEANVGFIGRAVGADKEAVVARLLGKFDGWEGRTVFKLENGQIWQQSEHGELAGVHLDAPMVTISPGVGGAWWLKVEGRNSRVKVKRIK